ncbi:MAG TPA: hypothetical protein PLU35_13825, partial [Phycisphaerales bacterium]|nr:hypothetical protein [Phycisphaerales bacterium]
MSFPNPGAIGLAATEDLFLYGPETPGNAVSLQPDPADADRTCLRVRSGSTSIQGYRQRWEHGNNEDSPPVTFSDRPPDILSLFEVELQNTSDLTTNSGVAAGTTVIRFQADDGAGGLVNINVDVNKTSGQAAYRGRLVGAVGTAQTFNPVGTRPEQGFKCVIAVYWKSSSNPGTATDGICRVWIATSASADIRIEDITDPASQMAEVVTITNHTRGVLASWCVGIAVTGAL